MTYRIRYFQIIQYKSIRTVYFLKRDETFSQVKLSSFVGTTALCIESYTHFGFSLLLIWNKSDGLQICHYSGPSSRSFLYAECVISRLGRTATSFRLNFNQLSNSVCKSHFIRTESHTSLQPKPVGPVLPD